ncbi:SDR family oxidoreductase [Cupriavidus necator]|uniref:SDR family oxidoreductase n=1 Tax=Cupriavidus necator TaxID=106590 RepID=UPI0005B485AA|nr:SDR family oxidoreductase [Cupriavidus necator]
MDDFAGKVAVITGAGSGFGRELARIGSQLGMNLVLADVQRDALDATAAEMQAAGTRAIAEVVDVAKSEQVQRLADVAFGEFGNVHLLFNNAGVGGSGLLWETTEADWQWVMSVNLTGVVNGVRHFVPRMLAANAQGEPGHIVNTASVAGLLCPPLLGVYNVSKHGVVALTETLHHDLRLAKSSIGVSVLCPGFVPTGIAQSERNRPADLANAAAPSALQLAAKAQFEKDVSSNKITAAEVAQLTFDAIRTERFYVFTHPEMLPAVQARFDAVLGDGGLGDPFATDPGGKLATAS